MPQTSTGERSWICLNPRGILRICVSSRRVPGYVQIPEVFCVLASALVACLDMLKSPRYSACLRKLSSRAARLVCVAHFVSHTRAGIFGLVASQATTERLFPHVVQARQQILFCCAPLRFAPYVTSSPPAPTKQKTLQFAHEILVVLEKRFRNQRRNLPTTEGPRGLTQNVFHAVM